jgi:predicted ATPase/DNA-binding XRE family transcriptional regulator
MPAMTAQNLSAQTFGELLRHLRQRARMTQDELGIAVGYSRAHIARLENNQRLPDPSAVRARFFEPLDLKPASPEAAQLVALAAAAHDSSSVEETEPERQTPNNLPYPVTSFVGRTEALAELQRLLPATRLLTLTGVGGTGKTRLALELASRVLKDFPDGVWLVELAPVTNPAQVAQSALTAVGIRETAGMTPTAALVDVLRSKQTLLILDNCEHVIDVCAQLVETVIRSCPKTHILTTSRETLGLAGELGWRVPSLAVPESTVVHPDDRGFHEAIALFVQRAQLALAGFNLTQTNATAIVEICKRLDGIPLAIELAAARVKAMSPGEIAERLNDRFRLLTGGSRTALPRQQTLHALIEWSYRLLTQPEQLLFCRLCVFQGGWTIATAEVVCSGAGVEKDELLNLLVRLVEKSLVLVDNASGETRYRFLETVRQFAQERLNDLEDTSRYRLRHAEAHLAVAQSATLGLHDDQQQRSLNVLSGEFANLRAALVWSFDTPGSSLLGCRLVTALFHFWQLDISRHQDAHDWSMMAVSKLTNDMPPVVRAWALLCEEFFAWRIEGSIERTYRLHNLFVEAGEPLQAAVAKSLIGRAYFYETRDFPTALRYSEEAVTESRPFGNTWELRTSLEMLGECLRISQHDVKRAETAYREAGALAEAVGDRIGAVSIKVYYLIPSLMEQLAFSEALRIASATLPLAEHLGSIGLIYYCLYLLSDCSFRIGHTGTAEQFLLRAERIANTQLTAANRFNCNMLRAGFLLAKGQLSDARRLLGTVLQDCRDTTTVNRFSRLAETAVDALAAVAAAQGEAKHGATLRGIADHMFELNHHYRSGHRTSDYAPHIEKARAVLGDPGYARAYAEGRNMPMQDAFGYVVAREWTNLQSTAGTERVPLP